MSRSMRTLQARTLVCHGFDPSKLRLGMSREEVIQAFGQPEQKIGMVTSDPVPHIFKYHNGVEFHFHYSRSKGLLYVMEVVGGEADDDTMILFTLFPFTGMSA